MTSTTGHGTYFNGKIISLPEVGNRDNALTYFLKNKQIDNLRAKNRTNLD
jgi:hypothetical protein